MGRLYVAQARFRQAGQENQLYSKGQDAWRKASFRGRRHLCGMTPGTFLGFYGSRRGAQTRQEPDRVVSEQFDLGALRHSLLADERNRVGPRATVMRVVS